MVSIKHPVLLNVLVWISPQMYLLNNLVYVKFWEPQYMKIKKIKIFLKKCLSKDQYYLNFKF